MGTVHQISEARKRKAEEGEVMHLVLTPGHPHPTCPSCQFCCVCGHSACNKSASDFGHIWTSDVAVWSNHTHCCKPVPLIGESE